MKSKLRLPDGWRVVADIVALVEAEEAKTDRNL
jgi:hypothetical protein